MWCAVWRGIMVHGMVWKGKVSAARTLGISQDIDVGID